MQSLYIAAVAVLALVVIVLSKRHGKRHGKRHSKFCGTHYAFGGHIGNTASAMSNHIVGPAVTGYEYVH